MSATVDQLEHDVLLLSKDDRAHLAQILLQSLEAEVDDSVGEEWDVEVARRLERVVNGTAEGRPADAVFRDIRSKYGASA